MAATKEFDVVLSFASFERPYAQALYAILKHNGLIVFLDEEYQHEIWGENLVEYLNHTYRERGLFCVMFISEKYIDRPYTRVERRATLDRMMRQEDVYLLPVKVDETRLEDVPGLPHATAFLDLRQHGVIGVAELLLRKAGRLAGGSRVVVPVDLFIPRVPAGSIPAEQLIQHLISFCQQQPVRLFGAVIYDERHAELRRLLTERAYWDALNVASGPDFEVFAVRDSPEISMDIGLVTMMSPPTGRSRRSASSSFLAKYFGEKDTSLAYPSVVLWVVEGGKISTCRLIPFPRGTLDESFLRLQALFQLIADTVAQWRREPTSGGQGVWDVIKSALLDKDYTLYIQRSSWDVKSAAGALKPFLE